MATVMNSTLIALWPIQLAEMCFRVFQSGLNNFAPPNVKRLMVVRVGLQLGKWPKDVERSRREPRRDKDGNHEDSLRIQFDGIWLGVRDFYPISHCGDPNAQTSCSIPKEPVIYHRVTASFLRGIAGRKRIFRSRCRPGHIPERGL